MSEAKKIIEISREWGKSRSLLVIENKKLRSDNKILLEALKFYANEKHYEYEPPMPHPDAESGGEEVFIDLGKIARQAIQKIKGE